MADVRKIKTPDGTEYNIKDAEAVHGPASSTDRHVVLFDGTTGKLVDEDTGIYGTSTTGQLNATSYKVNEQCTLQWNATTSSLDFVFS